MFTRRTFLERVGQVGGATAVYGAMEALGLMPAAATPERFALQGDGRGKKILILGAGMAGICTAYEMGKRGYDCHLLEARQRPGGRCHTIRRGTVEVETTGQKQTCAFDEGLYMNPGPARIPQHHVTLDYCRELGVSIEPFGNHNDNAYYYNENCGPLSGKRVRVREARADVYGYTAELLAKAVNQPDLDKRLTPEDKTRLVTYLREEGGLSEDLFYRGTVRRGYAEFPGAGETPGKATDAFDLSAILQAGFGAYFSFTYEPEQQMMMFQIVGGTDNLARAFARKLPGKITYGAVVQEIRQSAEGVRVVYADAAGKPTTATADYCVCTIPLSVLKTIPADFCPAVKRAVASSVYMATDKIGLQFKRRFWEEDDRIFGGITRTTMSIGQIFYPSTGFLGKKGVLIGYYNFGFQAAAMGSLKHADREKTALTMGAKIHPQYPTEFENSFSISWEKTPYSLGGWAMYMPNGRQENYTAMTKPDGRIYLAGEHLSYLTGWMAGALESARSVCKAIDSRAAAETGAKKGERGR